MSTEVLMRLLLIFLFKLDIVRLEYKWLPAHSLLLVRHSRKKYRD